MKFNNLLIEDENAIQVITINRPSKLNALNKETIEELHEALKIAEEDKAIKVIIITGTGQKAFVAGADISEFYKFSVEEGKKLSAAGHENLFDFVEQLSKPVIAAVNGFALGGGLELAMSCHFRLASENAQLGLPETSLGVIPGYGGTQRLTRLAGKGKAFEIILTAGMINADEALNCGLINHITSSEELLETTKKIAKKISRNSTVAISAAIRAVNANDDKSKDGFLTEIEEFGKCFGTADFKEGTQAFIEKRKPNFPGK